MCVLAFLRPAQNRAVNAWEKAITGLAIYLGGADLTLNPGMFSSGLIVSYEQLVVDNEILDYLDRVVRGMQANPDTLVVDLVRKVGHGGQFLKEAHTLKQFKNEFCIPDVSCRAAFGRWMHKGGHDIVESAKEKARRLLSEHHPQELPAGEAGAGRQGFRGKALNAARTADRPETMKQPSS
jgi:trimethylamine--corrinoid protein Co-methyltransferase